MATITKYGIVNKVGISNSGAYIVGNGWLYDTQTQAHQFLQADPYFSKHPEKYTIAKIEYEDD